MMVSQALGVKISQLSTEIPLITYSLIKSYHANIISYIDDKSPHSAIKILPPPDILLTNHCLWAGSSDT
jgi:hypothetical protein